MAYKHLNWDSEFFGKQIYQIDAINNIEAYDWEEVINKKPDLIYCAIENPLPAVFEFMAKKGGILYDKKIKYFKSDFTAPVVPTTTVVKNDEFHYESTTVLTDDLEEMVYQSGAFSRFKLDPRLSEKFKALYKEWIVGSLNGRLADEVLLAKDLEGKSVGFITLSIKDRTGNIGLIAVNEQFRGRGLGKFLMQGADDFFRKKQASGATVITQQDNIPACQLYEKMGYTIIKNESIFHYYL